MPPRRAPSSPVSVTRASRRHAMRRVGCGAAGGNGRGGAGPSALGGERLDTRALERDKPLGVAPLAVVIPGGGVAVLFRYGAVVLFGTATATMDKFVAS